MILIILTKDTLNSTSITGNLKDINSMTHVPINTKRNKVTQKMFKIQKEKKNYVVLNLI